jgi:hypothetical protein
VLVIIGILGSLAATRFIDLVPNTEKKLLGAVVSEMNAREHMAYVNWMSDKTRTKKGKLKPYTDVDYSDLRGVVFNYNNRRSGTVEFVGGGSYKVWVPNNKKYGKVWKQYRSCEGPKIWSIDPR